MATCKICSKEYTPDDVYCSNCGNKIREDGIVEIQPKKERFPCSRKIAVILAFFLGIFGLHNWYLGQKTAFYIKISVSIISYGILAPIMWIWSIVEGFMIIKNRDYKDAYGIPLKK